MNIGIDMDGVIYPWQKIAYRYLQECGEDLPEERLFWNAGDNPVIDFLASLPFLYSRAFPKASVVSSINALSSAGHTIFYVTSRPDNCALLTEVYLRKHNFAQSSNVIVTKDKKTFALLLNIDVFIEDLPKYMFPLLDVCEVFGIQQTWNEHDRDRLESLGVVFFPTVVEASRKILCT